MTKENTSVDKNTSDIASIKPSVCQAGEMGTWILTYHVFSESLVAGSQLIISTDSDTDWEEPQTLDPDATGYLSLELPNRQPEEIPVSAALTIISVKKINLRILTGAVEKGESIVLTFGSGAGHRMQTFVEARRYFHIEVIDPTGCRRISPDSPFLRILGGPAESLVIINPTMFRWGTAFRFILKAQDQWGNPASNFTEEIELQIGSYQKTIKLPKERAVAWVEIPADALIKENINLKLLKINQDSQEIIRGVYRISAQSDSFSAKGNPMLFVETTEPMAEFVSSNGTKSVLALHEEQIWGDFHGGQVVDTEKIPDYYTYARDVSGLSFTSYQRNDHEMTDLEWDTQKVTEKEFTKPGEFIPLPGYEWSADVHLGGDRNVLFPRAGLPLLRSSFSAVDCDKKDSSTILTDQKALYDHYRYTNVILLPHVGGRQANLDLHDPQLEPVVEIASTHGTFEWFYLDALKRGYEIGVVAGSDGYTGRPGGEYPGFIARRFSRSGTTAIRTKELSLKGVLDAIRARKTYGTSGPRIYLDIRAQGPGIIGEIHLGEEARVRGPVKLMVSVAGTSEIDRVDIFRRDQLIHSFFPEGGTFKDRWRILMRGSASWKSYSGVQWLGQLLFNGAQPKDIVPLRFDSPRSFFKESEKQIYWDTTNCGYAHGLEFGLSVLSDACDNELEHSIIQDLSFNLSVESYLYNGMYSGAELPGTMRISRAPGERTQICGSLSKPQEDSTSSYSAQYIANLGGDRSVILEPIFEGRPEELSFSYEDPDIKFGVNPYWVRVTQRDMHNAWSSPVFVDYGP